jgi:hypothetical protein
MEDRVDPEVRWELEFVSDRRDFGDNGVWANEPVL